MKARKKVEASEISRELLPEQSPALLKELHLLTRDGDLNADARRKLKQVNHLCTLLKPALDDLFSRYESVQMVDVGAGKAYLGFILYELYFKSQESGHILSIENRADLVEKGSAMAGKLSYNRMKFINSTITDAPLPERVHLVTALHACDTATDDALIAGITAKADYIAVVPCCQAEVAQLLKAQKTPAWQELWRHGIHRREFGSHITNVIRALVLESLGYQVSVTELVGWEHSLKNEFILAKRVQNENKMALGRLKELLTPLNIQPKLITHFKL
ncbi:MAG: SAM-dependent methyltransferase [Oligoflexia bacterium]|nr:SAM-dependent methyltransferase [Oligoflexia bacterium]